MAKWIYERWSLKWDDTGFSGTGTGSFVGKVDIATMVASEASSVAVGDVAFTTAQAISGFNSGNNLHLRYVTSVSNDMNGSYKEKQAVTGANKEWLANQRIKDARQADVILEEGTVPDDGIHTDGFWYVKIKKAFPTMRIMRDGQWVEVETGYVLKDGVWKQIEEIYKLQDGKWVQA